MISICGASGAFTPTIERITAPGSVAPLDIPRDGRPSRGATGSPWQLRFRIGTMSLLNDTVGFVSGAQEVKSGVTPGVQTPPESVPP